MYPFIYPKENPLMISPSPSLSISLPTVQLQYARFPPPLVPCWSSPSGSPSSQLQVKSPAIAAGCRKAGQDLLPSVPTAWLTGQSGFPLPLG